MFKLPKDYQPSKSVEPGESFEVLAEIKLQEDGVFQISKIDGQALDDHEKSEPPAAQEEAFDDMVRLPTEALQ